MRGSSARELKWPLTSSGLHTGQAFHSRALSGRVLSVRRQVLSSALQRLNLSADHQHLGETDPGTVYTLVTSEATRDRIALAITQSPPTMKTDLYPYQRARHSGHPCRCIHTLTPHLCVMLTGLNRQDVGEGGCAAADARPRLQRAYCDGQIEVLHQRTRSRQ